MYSRTAFGIPSAVEGSTAMSQEARISGTSRRRPRNRKFLSRANSATCRSNSFRRSPSPTKTKRTCGNSRTMAGAAAINQGCPFTSLSILPTITMSLHSLLPGKNRPLFASWSNLSKSTPLWMTRTFSGANPSSEISESRIGFALASTALDKFWIRRSQTRRLV